MGYRERAKRLDLYVKKENKRWEIVREVINTHIDANNARNETTADFSQRRCSVSESNDACCLRSMGKHLRDMIGSYQRELGRRVVGK